MARKRKPKFNAAEKKVAAMKALDLRIAGASYQNIVDMLGYKDAQRAHEVISRMLDAYPAQQVEQLRREGLMRYERVIREMSVAATASEEVVVTDDDGNKRVKKVHRHDLKERIEAWKTVMRAQDSLNRLYGLNQETVVQDNRVQTLVVEADTLSNNMRAALTDDQDDLLELGEIVDVVTND